MKEDADRKNWTKPELIVLIRSNPEEIVLDTCKGTDIDGALNNFDNCMGPLPAPCAECSAIRAS